VSDLEKLRKAVRDYISEYDNPVPDYALRRSLRNQLRELSGAPAEPPPSVRIGGRRDV
jgi:hypothetical protein